MRRYPPQATGSPAVVQSHLDPKLPPRQHFHSSNSHVSGVESLSILQLFPTSHESWCPNPNMCKFLPEPKHSEAIKGRVRGTTNQGKRSSFPPRKQTPCFHLRSHPLHLGIQINHTLRQERTDRMVFLHSWHSFQEGSSLEGESVLTFIWNIWMILTLKRPSIEVNPERKLCCHGLVHVNLTSLTCWQAESSIVHEVNVSNKQDIYIIIHTGRPSSPIWRSTLWRTSWLAHWLKQPEPCLSLVTLVYFSAVCSLAMSCRERACPIFSAPFEAAVGCANARGRELFIPETQPERPLPQQVCYLLLTHHWHVQAWKTWICGGDWPGIFQVGTTNTLLPHHHQPQIATSYSLRLWPFTLSKQSPTFTV